MDQDLPYIYEGQFCTHGLQQTLFTIVYISGEPGYNLSDNFDDQFKLAKFNSCASM